MINLSPAASAVIKKLTENGFEAYAVGGAVRDAILGVAVSDFDVTTSATPIEVKAVLSGYKIFDTGLKHGTVTARVLGENVEITTFRTDGDYLNARRPESVEFVTDIREDLSRRDFTMNAVCYNDETGVFDPTGGVDDIKHKTIRAVGDPEKRFREDALRILRAVRFASVLGFKIEETTKKAMFSCQNLIAKLSKERVFSELKKTLLGDSVQEVLTEYREIFYHVIPELKPCYGFDQKSVYHSTDVFTHIVSAVALAPKDIYVRLALLYHDIAKPLCFCVDEEGAGHFKGHAALGAKIAVSSLKSLKADNFTVGAVEKLVYHHDNYMLSTRKDVLKMLDEEGIAFMRRLTELRRADLKAHFTNNIGEREKIAEKVLNIAETAIKNGECYSLKTLKINGSDIIKLGYKGEAVGRILNRVLSEVRAGSLKNDRAALLKKAESYGRVGK